VSLKSQKDPRGVSHPEGLANVPNLDQLRIVQVHCGRDALPQEFGIATENQGMLTEGVGSVHLNSSEFVVATESQGTLA
jgi:hypothetical protein